MLGTLNQTSIVCTLLFHAMIRKANHTVLFFIFFLDDLWQPHFMHKSVNLN